MNTLETSNDPIDFGFIVVSQLFRFSPDGALYIKMDSRFALKVNEGAYREGYLVIEDLGVTVYPVRVVSDLTQLCRHLSKS